nr:fumarate hydratase 2, chloroplastic-like (FUM2) [Polytomella parva]
MHIAVLSEIHGRLLPSLHLLQHSLENQAQKWKGILKVGRTHLQDATPLSLGDSFGALASQVQATAAAIEMATHELYDIAQGGTAVGTGVNSFEGFDELICQKLAQALHLPLKPAADKFAALACHDPLLRVSGAVSASAATLTKLGNDIRFLACGPRSGIHELSLPANEPGSSVMPGKVNPTQVEALVMVCHRVVGSHVTVSLSAAGGQCELNACKPLIVAEILKSIRLLADACTAFTKGAVIGLEAEEEVLKRNLENSLMLATALAPKFGYKKAAEVAKEAHHRGVTLKKAATLLGILTEEEFDQIVRPEAMIKPMPLEEFRQQVKNKNQKKK